MSRVRCLICHRPVRRVASPAPWAHEAGDAKACRDAPTVLDDSQLLSQFAREAIDMQDAGNLGELVGALRTIEGGSVKDLNRHPFAVLWVNKLVSLSTPGQELRLDGFSDAMALGPERGRSGRR